ncbi:hypothetical protein D3C83_81400 [compost metagenome]
MTATPPQTTQMAASQRRLISFNPPMPSIIMLLPRDTSSASNPQLNAPANALPSATRHAMLLTGINVHSQVYNVHTG